MIYTVTLNPSIDYVVHADNVKLGELNYMLSDLKLPGGKGINVSRILHELNTDTTALGFIGGFTGEFITTWLSRDGVNTDFVNVKEDTRINIKLKADAETEINGKGPAISEAEANQLLDNVEKISSEDMIVLSGSMPPTLPKDYYEQLVKRIIETGASFVIDTTGDALKSVLPYGPLLVKPNLEELQQLFNVTFSTKEDILHYGKQLLELGAKNVIVSMAGEGALLFTEDAIYQGISPKGEVKNSVGAGDSMIAGFIGEFRKTGDVETAFKMGLASGSATAFSDDLAKKEDILSLLDKVKVTRI
ncbi:1-phosphofructokinase [Oceanobacillus chungangensis]|uniref:Tagatose-6-phosphate kinase n=1 Tax=Oceanobacillus chungangensis TaxID=1229152 RepID=A0A3D8PUJ4_9BACI|nr:1-phosphofructokinase [Oceanobacillus chungangensis]RDW18981.1 1-phosphofructokinase [Oceanobacillus chungangensis]